MKTRDLRGSFFSCCGCGACAAACPCCAITMVENQDGFIYPEIDESRCVDCKACSVVCGFQDPSAKQREGSCYAASYQGDCSNSASGGVFLALARAVIARGGVVFGAAYQRDSSGLHVRHVMASKIEDLSAIQGSKYVQSDVSLCYGEVKRQLSKDRLVLFSGTPCQVAGLRGYLERGCCEHSWANLITVDLVCHGAPSEALFRSFIRAVEEKAGRQVVDVCFRCKLNGWDNSLFLRLLFDSAFAIDSDQANELFLSASDSAYYDLFLNLKIFRESCYVCPFAGSLRPGDLTIGDFWGVEACRGDVLCDERFDRAKGVSCLLVNNAHGHAALDQLGKELALFEVSFNDVAKYNDQLKAASVLPKDRKQYVAAFRNEEWEGVEVLWQRRERGVRYRVKQLLKRILPSWVLEKLARSNL